MSITVKINRKTVKKNKNAGNTAHHIYGKQTVRKTVVEDVTNSVDVAHGMKKWLKREYVGSTLDGIAVTDTALVSVQEALRPEVLGPPGGWEDSVVIQSSPSPLHHPPEPKWFYEYEPMLVTCRVCGEEFPHTDLQCESTWDADEVIFCDRVCPECGIWDCCEPLEFEKLADEELEAVAKLRRANKRKT